MNLNDIFLVALKKCRIEDVMYDDGVLISCSMRKPVKEYRNYQVHRSQNMNEIGAGTIGKISVSVIKAEVPDEGGREDGQDSKGRGEIPSPVPSPAKGEYNSMGDTALVYAKTMNIPFVRSVATPTRRPLQRSVTSEANIPLKRPLGHGARSVVPQLQLAPPPMSSLLFDNVIETMTPKQLVELENEYICSQGKIPSRKVVKLIGERIGLPQSRIRRWFLQKWDEVNNISRVTSNDYIPATVTFPSAENHGLVEQSTEPEIKFDIDYQLSICNFLADIQGKIDICHARLESFEKRLESLEEQTSSLKHTVDGLSMIESQYHDPWSLL